MNRYPVKLRVYLLTVNAIGIAAILGLLFFCYSRMILDESTFAWLVGATLTAGIVSFVLNVVLVRPLEQSVARIGEASAQIASGSFGTEVPLVGPTELRSLAERFNAMSRQLKDSFDKLRLAEKSRRELVANVAHDLRTPLALLQSHAEALQDGVVQDPETVGRYLETLRLESIRLGSLVQELFDLSRIDSGEEPYEPKKVALEDVFVQTLNAYAPKLEEKKLQVVVRLPEPSPIAMAMEQGMRRIVGNLLDNAVRHSPIGATLTLSAMPGDEGELVVAVRDEGDGIAPDELELVFERFYRSDRSRTRDGSGAGLGLAIAKSLAERMGGKIGAASAPGHGSEFWFTVPMAERISAKGAGA
ncbi:sensor histidine kinase [Cohnella suwonensis]|uniref:histidine kinase n=1 Tax=Cohnella suwonensis TaxID=696072 RepID=A0ABW0LWU1_9BACL